MNIGILSDLHGAPPPPLPDGVDLVLAAGDCYDLRGAYPVPVIQIAGNHEYYGGTTKWDLFQDGYVNRVELYPTKNLRVLACTLWTDFDLYGDVDGAKGVAAKGLNDFYQIPDWTTYKQEDEFFFDYNWLSRELSWRHKFATTIVMTHHAPSQRSIHSKYGKDPLNAAFASNLDDLLSQAQYWVHGHVHSPFDYEHNGCRVICNPKGYRGENPEPYQMKVISI